MFYIALCVLSRQTASAEPVTGYGLDRDMKVRVLESLMTQLISDTCERCPILLRRPADQMGAAALHLLADGMPV
jgi:hypothetical protein